MNRFRFPAVLALLSCLSLQSAYANELAIWDKLQGTNPKGYVLLLRHTLAPGVGEEVIHNPLDLFLATYPRSPPHLHMPIAKKGS